MSRALISILLIVVITLLVGLLWLAAANQPAPPAGPLLELEPIAAAYRAELNGTVRLANAGGDEVSASAQVRLSYEIHPDNRVKVSTLGIWIADRDLIVTFGFWEVAREKLRCTRFGMDGPLTGELANGEIQLSGATLRGESYGQRSASGQCEGKGRALAVSAPGTLLVAHDPTTNNVGINASFETSFDGQPLTVHLVGDGKFLNRPPVAEFRTDLDADQVDAFGCPGTRKGKPPVVVANSASGLTLSLHSESYDVDGLLPVDFNQKRPRVDLTFEQWATADADGLRYLGSGRDLGPVTFATGREHKLWLWVSDRHGAADRRLCHFEVVAP